MCRGSGRPWSTAPTNRIFHQYTLRVERRDELQAHLKSHGVGNAVYYPVPLHLQNCFRHLGTNGADSRRPSGRRQR